MLRRGERRRSRRSDIMATMDEPGRPISRRSVLVRGVPVIAAVAAGTAAFVQRGTDSDVRTGRVGAAPPDAPSATTDGASVFSPSDSTIENVATLPGATTATTIAPATTVVADPTPVASTTTLPPETSVVDTTTSSPAAAPIAPPPDPRGAEPLVSVGRIAIPDVGLDAPLYEGIRLTTLDNGPGHWPGTALPGEIGNVVVAAHRTSHGGAFRHLDQLAPGDAVNFTTDAGQSAYRVTGTQIVQPDAVWIVDPTPTPTATLFACHPPGSTSQRIVVTLELAV